jgi:hypothetical protein
MTLDASGNLLVGTTDGNFQSGKGIKVADATAARLRLCDTDAGVGATDGFDLAFAVDTAYVSNLENGPLVFGTNNTERARIDASGNLGVGTTSPSTFGKLATVAATTAVAFYAGTGTQGLFISTDDSTRLVTYASSGSLGGGHRWNVGNTEAARITSDGSLLVGDDTTSATSGSGIKLRAELASPELYIVGSSTSNNDSAMALYSTGASAFRFLVGYGGTISATNATISAISDIRYKENIRDLNVGLDAILALKPRIFDWKDGKGKDIKDDRGFIAQEFEEVFPDLIDEWKDPAPEGEAPYKAVRQDLIPVLVKAIQEQQAMIAALEARLEALEA